MTAKQQTVRRFNWKLATVLALGLLVLAGTLWGLSRWRREYTASLALETGLKAYQERNWSKAAKDLGQWVAVHQRNVDARCADILQKYADAQLRIYPQKAGNVTQAVAALRLVIRQNPAETEAADRAAQVYIQMGMPGDAEWVIRRRLQAKDDARGRQMLAMALAGQRKYKEAAQELAGVISKAPDTISAYQMLAEIMRAHAEEVPGSPLEQLKTAVAANPKSAEAHLALGAYLYMWGEGPESRAQAKAEYGSARRAEITDGPTRVRLAGRLIEIGEPAAAEEELASAAKTESTGLQLWRTWAELVRVKAAPGEASDVARRALEALGPDRYPFVPTAIELFLYGNNEAEAAKSLKDLEQADPYSADIGYFNGLMAEYRGETHKAIAYWQKAAKDDSATPRVRLALAGAYEKINDLPSAMRQLRILASRFPQVSAVRVALARTAALEGSWREAAASAGEALLSEPQNVEAQLIEINARAHIAAAEKAPETAWREILADVAELKRRFPDAPQAAILEANVALLRGDAKTGEQVAATLEAKEETKLQGMRLEVESLWVTGRQEEAAARVQEMAAQFSGDIDVTGRAVEILARTGKSDAAMALVEDGIQKARGDDKRTLEITLARLFMRLGDAAKARATLESVAAEYPDDIVSRAMLLSLSNTDAGRAQKLIDQIKAIEGDEGFRWRLFQARLWMASPDWRMRQGQIAELLNTNIKSDAGDTESQLVLGQLQEKLDQLSLAIETYRRAYAQQPESAPAVFYLVSALQRNNDLEEAGRVLDDAARRGLAEPRLANLRLGQQLREGKTALAIRTAEEMLERDGDNVTMKVFVANLKTRAGDLAGSHAILDKLDSGDPNVLAATVDLLLREGKRDEALALCDGLVGSAKNVGAHLFRARTRVIVGELDAAEEDYREVTKLEPGKVQGWVVLSDFLAARKKMPEATAAIEKALSIDPTAPSAVVRAVRLYSASPDAETRKTGDSILEAALERNPQDESLLLLRAQKLMARNTADSLQEAYATLDRLTQMKPRLIEAWRLMAQTALMEGLPDRALGAVSRALAADPDEAQRRSLLMFKAAAEKVRWPVLAVATLRGLWETDKSDVTAGLALVNAYRETGEPRKASAALQEMSTLVKGRDLVTVQLALADLLWSGGNTDEGMKVASGSAAAAPDDPRPVLTMMLLHAREGRLAEARGALGAWQKAHPKDIGTDVLAAETLLSASDALASGSDAAGAQKSQQAADEAVAILEDTLARFPDNTAVKLALAVACQRRRLAERAEGLYRQVLAKDKDNSTAINNLAWLLSEDKVKGKEALALADRGRSLYPAFTELIDTRGVIYHRLGRLDDAAKELGECVRVSPVGSRQQAAAQFHLAAVLADQGKNDEALRLLRDALGKTQPGRGLTADERAEAEALLSRLAQSATGSREEVRKGEPGAAQEG